LADPPPVKPDPAPTLKVELAKLVFGIADKPKVIVSGADVPKRVSPSPDEDANIRDPDALSAIIVAPFTEADAKLFLTGEVTIVKYPASLLNCETLLPETTTFFQVAMFYCFILLINISNY
jgi:hypothetical protein